MVRIAAVVSALGLTLGASGAQAAMVYGMGLQTCADWAAEAPRPQGADQDPSWTRLTYTAWVSGYLSALNVAAAPAKGNILGAANMKAAMTWLDRYCESHPLEPVNTGVQLLSIELMQRQQRTP